MKSLRTFALDMIGATARIFVRMKAQVAANLEEDAAEICKSGRAIFFKNQAHNSFCTGTRS
jgi:hypothetical protein